MTNKAPLPDAPATPSVPSRTDSKHSQSSETEVAQEQEQQQTGEPAFLKALRITGAEPKLVAYIDTLRREIDRVREAALDSNMEKLMALTDEQVAALTRMDGHHPDDVAKIGKLIGEKVILQHDLERAESSLRAAQQQRDEILEEAARVCETVYAKDAFHFELGTACAQAIRSLKSAQQK